MLAAFVICSPLAAAVLWRLASQYNPVEDAMSGNAYGDCFPVLTDADLVDQLRSIEGTHCEVGCITHTNGDTL